MANQNRRSSPRVYCRFGDEGKKFHRFCPTKPFPENGSAELREKLQAHFAQIPDAKAKKRTTAQTTVKFYLGVEGKETIAQSISVFEDAVDGPHLAQDNLELSMKKAWEKARKTLGLPTEVPARHGLFHSVLFTRLPCLSELASVSRVHDVGIAR